MNFSAHHLYSQVCQECQSFSVQQLLLRVYTFFTLYTEFLRLSAVAFQMTRQSKLHLKHFFFFSSTAHDKTLNAMFLKKKKKIELSQEEKTQILLHNIISGDTDHSQGCFV